MGQPVSSTNIFTNSIQSLLNLCNYETPVSYNLKSIANMGTANYNLMLNKITVGTWNIDGWNAATLKNNHLFKNEGILLSNQ